MLAKWLFAYSSPVKTTCKNHNNTRAGLYLPAVQFFPQTRLRTLGTATTLALSTQRTSKKTTMHDHGCELKQQAAHDLSSLALLWGH